jgi:hypothetical protein
VKPSADAGFFTSELGVPDETLQKGPAQLEPKRTVV